MSTEENKAVLRRAWEEIYGKKRLDFLGEMLADDVIVHEPDADVRGIEGVRTYLATYLTAFPDTSVTIEELVAEEDKVVSRYTVRGTHQGTTKEYGSATGTQMMARGITLYHFKGGKVVEIWDHFDSLPVTQ